MAWARRVTHRAARRVAGALPPAAREVAAAFAARAIDGPALLPGPPPGPVLVIAPHPDDETIGAGGAIARHLDRGDKVTILVATSGEATSGRAGTGGAGSGGGGAGGAWTGGDGTGGAWTGGAGGGAGIAAAREAECRAACAALGAGAPVFLRLPDGRLGEEIGALASAIGRYGQGARTVYVPSPLDPHRDHRAANAALARAGLDGEVYGYEVWQAAPVDVLLDVTSVYARKEAALRAYAVALGAVDYVRAAAGLAAYRSSAGGMGGKGYAEGFLRLAPDAHAAAVATLAER